MSAASAETPVDPFLSEEFQGDPASVIARMRDEDPVHLDVDPRTVRLGGDARAVGGAGHLGGAAAAEEPDSVALQPIEDNGSSVAVLARAHGGEGIDAPALAGRHHVAMGIQRHDWAPGIFRAEFLPHDEIRAADHAVRLHQIGRHRVTLDGEAKFLQQFGGPRGVREGLSAHIVYDGPLRPPIAKGQVVARLVIEGPNFQTQEFPLAAGRKIGRANWFSRAFEGLRLTLFGP